MTEVQESSPLVEQRKESPHEEKESSTDLETVLSEIESLDKRQIAQKIVEERIKNLEAERKAGIDDLTGLWRKKAFFQRANEYLSHAKRAGEPFAIAFIDFDYFNKINNEYGHVVGDAVLASSAEALKKSTRPFDILCRWGGDEFVALLVDFNPDKITDFKDRLTENLKTSIISDIPNIDPTKVALSMGIAEWRGQEDINDIVKEADTSMYSYKKARNKP